MQKPEAASRRCQVWRWHRVSQGQNPLAGAVAAPVAAGGVRRKDVESDGAVAISNGCAIRPRAGKGCESQHKPRDQKQRPHDRSLSATIEILADHNAVRMKLTSIPMPGGYVFTGL